MSYPINTVSLPNRVSPETPTKMKFPQKALMSRRVNRIKAFLKGNLVKTRVLEEKKSTKTIIEGVYNKTDSKLTKLGLNTPEEKHLFIILFAAILFSAACHVMQITFFLILGNLTLALINFLSICIYVVCLVLLNKKNTALSGVIFSVEVSVVAVLLAYLIGIDTFLFAYFFVILLIQMIIPYAGWKTRIPIMAGISVLVFISLFIGKTMLPVVDITPIKTVYSIFNIAVGISSIIAIIAVNNAVSKIILQFNKIKLDKYMDAAHVDSLTGLYNRRYAKLVFEEINSDAEQRDTWCIAMLDIDDFKHINDTYGHDSGDAVLREFARILKTSLRKTDYVFRWGGEEFLLLLRDTDISDSYYTLDKMRSRIQESDMNIAGKSIHATVTIGLSKCFSSDIDQSIKTSDRNLYKGKCIGKNIVVM